MQRGARGGGLWRRGRQRADFGTLRAGWAEFVAHSGSTSIFIAPGFEFCVVGALLTNFHLPQSSLLMLVSAFAGREQVLRAYRHAVERGIGSFLMGLHVC